MTTLTAQSTTFFPAAQNPTVDVAGSAKRLALAATRTVTGAASTVMTAATRPSAHRAALEGWTCVGFAAAGISLHFIIG